MEQKKPIVWILRKEYWAENGDSDIDFELYATENLARAAFEDAVAAEYDGDYGIVKKYGDEPDFHIKSVDGADFHSWHAFSEYGTSVYIACHTKEIITETWRAM